MEPTLFVTVTFASQVSDEITCEGISRRIVSQLQRAVVGKRTKSRLPCFVVLERNKNGALHIHILIGKVQGKTRALESTTLKKYIQKQALPSLLKILKRLTIRAKKDESNRVGKCDIRPVFSKEGAVDYMLKAIKPKKLCIAWLATYLNFSTSSAAVRPLRPERPKRKKRKREHT
jgi:hypothetical protein